MAKTKPKKSAPKFVPTKRELHALETIRGAGINLTDKALTNAAKSAHAYHSASAKIGLSNRELLLSAWGVILKLVQERDEWIVKKQQERKNAGQTKSRSKS